MCHCLTSLFNQRYSKTSHFVQCFCFLDCPQIKLEALNGSACNGDVVVSEPTTVAFNCTYENPPPSRTMYNWSLDGNRLPQFTSYMAAIPIPSGTHYVTCAAHIDIPDSMQSSANPDCTCKDRSSVTVTANGT